MNVNYVLEFKNPTFGACISLLAKRYSVKYIAKVCGVNYNSAYRWHKGKGIPPQYELREKLMELWKRYLQETTPSTIEELIPNQHFNQDIPPHIPVSPSEKPENQQPLNYFEAMKLLGEAQVELKAVMQILGNTVISDGKTLFRDRLYSIQQIVGKSLYFMEEIAENKSLLEAEFSDKRINETIKDQDFLYSFINKMFNTMSEVKRPEEEF